MEAGSFVFDIAPMSPDPDTPAPGSVGGAADMLLHPMFGPAYSIIDRNVVVCTAAPPKRHHARADRWGEHYGDGRGRARP